MKTSRLSALFFVSGVLVLIPVRISRSCTFDYVDPWDYPNISYFYDQTVFDAGEYEPLLYTQHEYYSKAWTEDNSSEDANVAEWREMCEDAPSTEDTRALVYNYSPEMLMCIGSEVDSTHFSAYPEIHQKSVVDMWANARESALKNSLAQYWITHAKKKTIAMIDYLIFAKTCQPLCGFRYFWGESKEERMIRQNLLRESLVVVGRRAYHALSDEELRLRYAYQLVRIEQYAGQYQHSVELYDSLVAPIKTESIIRYWALMGKAGSLWHLHRESEAAYLFSRIFDEYTGRRQDCFESFRIKNDTVWAECMALCRSDHEKAVLYFMRGVDYGSNALEEMKGLYSTEPKSTMLDVLLAREMAKLDDRVASSQKWTGGKWNDYGERWWNDSGLVNYVVSVDSFVTACTRTKNIRTSELWEYSAAYLRLLEGKYEEAAQRLNMLRAGWEDPTIVKACKIAEIAANVMNLKEMTSSAENQLFQQVDSTGDKTLFTFYINHAATQYKSAEDASKAMLCSKPLESIRSSESFDEIESLLNLARKKNHTRFEEYLLGYHRPELDWEFLYDTSRTLAYESYENDPPAESATNLLLETKGTLYLRNRQLSEAIEVFKLLPAEQLTPMENPFYFTISDCDKCGIRPVVLKGLPVPSDGYTKLKIAEQMLALEQMIKKSSRPPAILHFLLGNAYYNLTSWGINPNATRYDLGNRFWVFPDKSELPNYSIAQEHYKEGMKLAMKAKNKELAAQCCFAAAKCEAMFYYNSDVGDASAENLLYRTYFRTMKKSFSKTQYYREVIKECSVFRNFAIGHQGGLAH